MPRLQAKSFAKPDEEQRFPRVHFATVGLDDASVGHCRFEAGWTWSVDVAPLLGVTSCPIRHVGYSMSGTVHVVMDDGEALDIGPDTAFLIPPGHDKWVVGDEPWETIEWGSSGRAIGEAIRESGQRTLGTVLFTDIVDSTARAQAVGDGAWRDLLAGHTGRLRDVLNVHRGREIKTTGDGLLAMFDSPKRAVRCGRAMTVAASALDLPIRVGVHTGEVEMVGDDVRGIAVHTAARILALAGPDQVLISSATAALLEGSDVQVEDAGTHELKGLPGLRQLFRVTAS